MHAYLQQMELNIKILMFLHERPDSHPLDMAYVAAGRFDGYFQVNLNVYCTISSFGQRSRRKL